jgi:hypothetical protein
MTWVVGAASVFGYGVMISDVRVTFPSGQTADALRKAFPVGPYVVAGFAGSVYIGYQLLGSLEAFLFVPPSAAQADRLAWQPEWVAQHWSPEAKRIFAAAPHLERRLGSQLLLVGVSPNENMGAPEIPRVYIVRFSSPHFVPGFMRKGLRVAHIGSGAGIERYKRAFRQHFRYGASSLRAEVGGQHGWARMLGHTAEIVTDEHPVQGVSPHMHILVCRRGGIDEGVNDRRTYLPDGSEPVEFRMPKVAETYEAFQQMCSGLGFGAEGALA